MGHYQCEVCGEYPPCDCVGEAKPLKKAKLPLQTPEKRYFVGLPGWLQTMLIENADSFNCIKSDAVDKVQEELKEQVENLERLSAALSMHEEKHEYPLVVRQYRRRLPYIGIGGPDQHLRTNSFVEEVGNA
jgi:hypothetical protein